MLESSFSSSERMFPLIAFASVILPSTYFLLYSSASSLLTVIVMISLAIIARQTTITTPTIKGNLTAIYFFSNFIFLVDELTSRQVNELVVGF